MFLLIDEAIFAGFKDGDDVDKDFGMNGVVSELLLPLIAGLRIDDAILYYIFYICIMYCIMYVVVYVIYNNNMYIILLLFLFNPLLFCL